MTLLCVCVSVCMWVCVKFCFLLFCFPMYKFILASYLSQMKTNKCLGIFNLPCYLHTCVNDFLFLLCVQLYRPFNETVFFYHFPLFFFISIVVLHITNICWQFANVSYSLLNNCIYFIQHIDALPPDGIFHPHQQYNDSNSYRLMIIRQT